MKSMAMPFYCLQRRIWSRLPYESTAGFLYYSNRELVKQTGPRVKLLEEQDLLKVSLQYCHFVVHGYYYGSHNQ